MIDPTLSELYQSWWGQPDLDDVIPADQRCWKCEARRAAKDSDAGLCTTCRDELRRPQREQ